MCTSESHLHYCNYFESDLVQLTQTTGTYGAAINLCIPSKYPVIIYIDLRRYVAVNLSQQSHFTIIILYWAPKVPLYCFQKLVFCSDGVLFCQDGGAVGFVDFTKLLFALPSLAQPLKQVRSISEHLFVILNQRKAWAGRFREETVGKRTGPIARWPLRRLLFTRLEIDFVTISSFTKRTKVAQKVFQEG